MYIPVINGLTDEAHSCQALWPTRATTILERLGGFDSACAGSLAQRRPLRLRASLSEHPAAALGIGVRRRHTLGSRGTGHRADA